MITLFSNRCLAFCVAFYVSVGSSAIAQETKLPFRLPANYRSLPATALIETTKGPFEIKFYRKYAPISVANFQFVVGKGMYNGTTFHRYEPGVLIQGGDPTHTGRGGPKWTLPPEITSEVRHVRGAVAWARLRDEINPERRSNASQFYVTLRPQPLLDGFYTVFAQVIRGMENVDQLRVGDRILAVKFPKEGPEADEH